MISRTHILRCLFSAICAALPFSFTDSMAAAHAASHPAVDYSRLFPQVFSRQGPPLRRIALTFDDGPDLTYTPQILQALAHGHVHATFFVLGEHVRRYPAMTKRILREGHAIGNHTFDHANLLKVSNRQLVWEVQTTDRDLQQITGFHTKWFRAPYGNINAGVLTTLGHMGYQAVNWTVDSMDWRSLSAQQIKTNVIDHAFPGAIILQHCAGNSKEILTGSVQALPYIITSLRKKGYEFVTIPELMAPASKAVHATHGKSP